MSVRRFLNAAMTWYSGFFQLSLVTRFACDIGQLARIWIRVSSEVITILVSIWISVYQLNTSYSLLRRTDETQQGRNSCLRLQMLASVWTLSCHCPVKLLTQYQPCIIVCYSVYFWLIRSFTDPAFTGSIFVCGPLHHVLLSSIFGGRRSFQIRYAAHF